MNTPLGSLEVGPEAVQSTTTTVRLPGGEPEHALVLVIKKLASDDLDAGRAYELEKEGVRAGFGDNFREEGEGRVQFLNGQRPCWRYSFQVGEHRVTQVLAVAACPYGLYSVTASALSERFDEQWPRLEQAIASFQPSFQPH
ncbi:MAG: hypothetical protein KatS3mg102_0393 [Planctomycetota bacterium]|nr:MAG: hypothetical protein KatS3mg102_0393 [Planctomycetota bacterium]